MWDLPGPGLESVYHALAGGFLTTAPPGKSKIEVSFSCESPGNGSCLIMRPRLLILPSSKCRFHLMVQDDCSCPCHQVGILVSGEKIKGQSPIPSSSFFEGHLPEDAHTTFTHIPWKGGNLSFFFSPKVDTVPAKNHVFCNCKRKGGKSISFCC